MNLMQSLRSVPEQGQLAMVRQRRYVVTDVRRSLSAPKVTSENPSYLVSLASIEDDALGEELQVVWELEPGAEAFEKLELPKDIKCSPVIRKLLAMSYIKYDPLENPAAQAAAKVIKRLTHTQHPQLVDCTKQLIGSITEGELVQLYFLVHDKLKDILNNLVTTGDEQTPILGKASILESNLYA